MSRFDVTTFGEGGLRLSVPHGERIETANQFDVNIAGAEGNVVGALARFGRPTGWHSGLPDTPAGRRVAHEYRGFGIDLSSVVWTLEGRVSVYYVEYATPPRPTKVYFDRADSCLARLTVDDIDWDYLLDTEVVHLTGITPPLSETASEITAELLTRARSKGITTSFDVNYRSLLWSPDEARKILSPLLRNVDILFCGKRDAESVFGCDGTPEEIIDQLGGMSSAKHIVVTLSEDGVIGWNGEAHHHIPAKPVHVIDRIGAGDAMVAGVLHGYLNDDFVSGLHYGSVMSALAMSQHGDMVVTTEREVRRIIGGVTGGIMR